MNNQLDFNELQKDDLDEIVASFKSIGWNKPRNIYEDYLTEQSKGIRSVILAKKDKQFYGYVTIKWKSDYPYFNEQNIPEIVDLNVLPAYQNRGIGTQLIEACEEAAHMRGFTKMGIGVGLTKDYGNAQRLYVKLGYVPDGRGLHHKNQPVNFGDQISADDDLVLYFTKSIALK